CMKPPCQDALSYPFLHRVREGLSASNVRFSVLPWLAGHSSHGGRYMVARPLLAAGIASLLLASPVLASPAAPSGQTQAASSGQTQDVPPPQDRIAATNATFDAIEAKIAAGQSLRLRFPDPTAAEDIIDYGLHD